MIKLLLLWLLFCIIHIGLAATSISVKYSMSKKGLIFTLFIISIQISKAQENGFTKPFKKFYVDAGFLIFPSEKSNFTTGWDIYTDISEKWAIGLNGFVPIQLKFPMRYSQPFLIAGIFARYKARPNDFFHTDMGVGYGNLCNCDMRPNYKGFHRLDEYSYFLQAGLGTRYLVLNPYLRFRPSLKLFYLLKPVINNRIIFMPYLGVAIPIVKERPPITMNPRF
jgi:hypothetical protein